MFLKPNCLSRAIFKCGGTGYMQGHCKHGDPGSMLINKFKQFIFLEQIQLTKKISESATH